MVVRFFEMLLLSTNWPRPPGRREILKWTKIWRILLGHASFARRIGEEDILTAEIEELEKLDASETYPRRLNAKEVLITLKDGEFMFPVADGSAKLSGRLRIPRTHSETEIHRKERISAQNVMAIGKSFNLKKQKMMKESMRIFGPTQKLGKNFTYRHHIEPRSSTYVPREESFLISMICIIERNSSEKKYTMRVEDWRSQNIWGKRNSIVFGITGKRRNSVPCYNFAQEFVPMKRS